MEFMPGVLYSKIPNFRYVLDPDFLLGYSPNKKYT